MVQVDWESLYIGVTEAINDILLNGQEVEWNNNKYKKANIKDLYTIQEGYRRNMDAATQGAIFTGRVMRY